MTMQPYPICLQHVLSRINMSFTLPLSKSLLSISQSITQVRGLLLLALLALRCNIQDGSPLPLTDILQTSLFRKFALDGTETTSFGVSLPASSFPLLSQGDHPTVGTPCWYFHPCETSASVDEVMKEVMQDDWTESQQLVRWMEAWFMVLCTTVNLKE